MLFLFIINNEIIHRFWDSVDYANISEITELYTDYISKSIEMLNI
jgi:hypothetical protein